LAKKKPRRRRHPAVEQLLPGNLSTEDWAVLREVLSAVREALPSADQQQPGEVFRHVLEALRQADAKLIS
jgi:hypothetical protein